jgi:N-acetyl-anhydromuramyl-L-alanine amidase AmpD
MIIKKHHLPPSCYSFCQSREIKYLVLHHIASKSPKEAIAMLMHHQVSAHFLIDFEGIILELVSPNNIAYHAGFSYWQGDDGLNANSIGIEFVNQFPENQPFSQKQLQAGIELLQKLIKKYHILQCNILGHSDIAYFADSQLLNRKQDPSSLFDWQLLAKHNIGFFPQISSDADFIKFRFGDCHQEIAQIKHQLNLMGYKVLEFSCFFNTHMQQLATVFNRRFNNITTNNNHQHWLNSSSLALAKYQQHFNC